MVTSTVTGGVTGTVTATGSGAAPVGPGAVRPRPEHGAAVVTDVVGVGPAAGVGRRVTSC